MKKFLMMLFLILSINTLSNPAMITRNNRERLKKEQIENEFLNKRFVMYNNQDRIDELLQDNQILSFYTETTNSYHFRKENIERKINYIKNYIEDKGKNIEILHVEMIIFYDIYKLVIVYNETDKEFNKKKEWWE